MKYLRIIVRLYKAAIMRDLEFRTSFASMLGANIAWTNFTLITILLINSNSSNFGGWGKYDLLVLTGCWMIVNFMMYSFVYGNIRRLVRDIFNGNLDFFLLKPIDTEFLVTTQRFALGAIGSLIEGVVVIVHAVANGGYELNPLNIIGFVCLIFSGSIIYYSFWIITAAINIFSPLADNLLFIIPEVNYLSKFPTEAFPKFVSQIFTTVIPVMIITVLPAQMLMGKLSWQGFTYGIIVAVLFFVGSRKFWNWSLRHYTSASS